MAALRSPLMFPARRPDNPPMLMILPHPLRCMCGAAALAHRMYPTTLVLMSSSKSSSSADALDPARDDRDLPGQSQIHVQSPADSQAQVSSQAPSGRKTSSSAPGTSTR